jgi:hypothetical protein
MGGGQVNQQRSGCRQKGFCQAGNLEKSQHIIAAGPLGSAAIFLHIVLFEWISVNILFSSNLYVSISPQPEVLLTCLVFNYAKGNLSCGIHYILAMLKTTPFLP